MCPPLPRSSNRPHSRFEIDDLGGYRDLEGWSDQAKTYAAMVTRLDRDVGQLLALLVEMGVDDNTLVIFAGDNGSGFAEDSPTGRFFDQSMGRKLRGINRSMYEGGLRQGAIARWPGFVPAGRVSDEPWAFWDFLPTAADLIGVNLPANYKTDGLSLLDFFKGGPARQREYFYWELHARSFARPSVSATGRPFVTEPRAKSSCTISRATKANGRIFRQGTPSSSPKPMR
jgi:arylsulfatase A-like enzyme